MSRIVSPFVRTEEAALYLGLSPRTMERFRVEGRGPLFRKLGGRVVYARSDLDNWADQSIRRSTSDRNTREGDRTAHPDSTSKERSF